MYNCQVAFDNIPKVNCYSLTDFHTFDYCPFRFYVAHHLDKKYEMEEGNYNMALGTLLDGAIKKFHQAKAYGQPASYLINILRASLNEIKDTAAKSAGKPSYYSAVLKFIDEDMVQKANDIFIKYYQGRGERINRSLGEVRFSQFVFNMPQGQYKIWGWPDTYEMGDDGVPEIIDYKYREDPERGKQNMDMDLMPKVYALLSSDFLRNNGYEKARFRVRFWTDPEEDSFYEDFDLESLSGIDFLFKQKIEQIINNKEVRFCEKPFCSACNSPKREEYLREVQKLFA